MFWLFVLTFDSLQAATDWVRVNSIGHSAKGQYVATEELRINYEQKQASISIGLFNSWQNRYVKPKQYLSMSFENIEEVELKRKELKERWAKVFKRYGIE
jgi:predicted secreted protein